MLDFLAVGDVMLDVFAGADVTDPAESVHAAVRVRGGGSALNAAVWAASEGARAGVVGRIGSDSAATMVRSELAEAGVEARLAVDREAATGTVVYTANGVVADRGATAKLAAADLPERLEARAVLVSGYALLHGDTEAAARAAIERANADWIAVDVASAALVEGVGAARTLELAQGANVLLANEDEAFALTGKPPREAAAALSERFTVACVKRGGAGALAASEGRMFSAAAPHQLEQDAAGAGDAFAAGLLVALVRGQELEQALELACRLGTAAAAAAA